jgi:hypothetical protein
VGHSQTVYIGITARTPTFGTLLNDADGVRRALRSQAGTRTNISKSRTWTRIAPAAIAASLALLVFGAAGAAAAPAATSSATADCWRAVVNDWLGNGRVDGVYAIPCYTQAIQHLNAYTDVRSYSSAADDIQRALLAAIRQDRGNGPGAGPGPTDPGSGPTSGPPGSGPTASGPSSSSHDGGLLGSWGPSDATAIPLPLLVLAALALLLLAAAAATWFARRFQARRVTPAPVRAPAVEKHR